jgi:cysteine desulfurase
VSDRLYLDHNATTALRADARAAMLAAIDVRAASSSPHAEGRRARAIVEEAREKVAALVGASPRNVIFTSGATEANATALTPHWQVGRDRSPLGRLLVGATEHASVLAGGRFGRPGEVLPATASGLPDLAEWERRIGGGEGRPLVSLMAANNETGVIQPIAAIAEMVRRAGGLLHCDAAQAAGKVALSLASLGADLVTLSSHKLGGPFGAGALVKTRDDLHLLDPLMKGGGQEMGARAGTENIVALAGFRAAAASAKDELRSEGHRQAALRDLILARLRAEAPNLVVFGEGVERLPNTLSFACPGFKAETLLMALDLEGVAVSSGSACSSGKVKASHVLEAMGVAPELSACALRLSVGRTTDAMDVDRFIDAWNRVTKRIHERQDSRAA